MKRRELFFDHGGGVVATENKEKHIPALQNDSIGLGANQHTSQMDAQGFSRLYDALKILLHKGKFDWAKSDMQGYNRLIWIQHT